MQTPRTPCWATPRRAAPLPSCSRPPRATSAPASSPTTGPAISPATTVAETRVPCGRIVTEFVAGQAVGQYVSRENPGGVPEGAKITFGEALEAAVLTAGDKPVEQSDAAAIQATGMNVMMPGSIAAQAQAAANANAWMTRDEDKTKLRDVLSEATTKLLANKPAERDDAVEVSGAEVRNKPDMASSYTMI
uniref:SMP domain-containing protein n=1 Tax=Ananas comosus var. bracteatus TaxID=296719 RepID=A0A6V7QU61_ANACO